jgi:tetratricopeptide (TPR) repeat protein
MIPPLVASATPSAPIDDARSWREPSPSVSAAAIFVLAILAYANTFGHGFVWDDPVLLEQKVRFYRGPLDAFFEPAGLPSMRMYRPLELLSLWIDARLWTSSTGFHVTQVLLHAVNGALVVLLARALGTAPWAALAGAALFVLHPVQVESVAWLTCRADVMTATFAVIAVLAFLRHQDRPAWWTVGAIAVAAFLATASKETGSVTPLLLLAVLATLPRPPDGFTTRLRRAWPALGAAVVGVGLCQALRPADVTTGIGRAALGAQDVLNLLGAFSYQLARVLAPVGFAPYVAKTPTDLGHLALAVGGGAVLLAALAAPARDGGVRRLGILWFLLAVAPAVAVVLADFSATPVAERRLYLAMVGVALVVATLLTRYRARAGSTAGIAAIAVLLVACAVVTVVRNAYWHDELTLWTAVTERVPDGSLPLLNLGLALADAGRNAEAEAAYRRVLTLDPTEVTRQRTDIDLGLVLLERGALDEAETSFTAANAIAPHAIAFRGLGMIALKRSKSATAAGDRATSDAELNRAHALLQRALAINPRYHQAYVTLGGVLYAAGQYRAALAQYQRALDLAGDTESGRVAAEAVQQLSGWLATHPEAP